MATTSTGAQMPKPMLGHPSWTRCDIPPFGGGAREFLPLCFLSLLNHPVLPLPYCSPLTPSNCMFFFLLLFLSLILPSSLCPFPMKYGVTMNTEIFGLDNTLLLCTCLFINKIQFYSTLCACDEPIPQSYNGTIFVYSFQDFT